MIPFYSSIYRKDKFESQARRGCGCVSHGHRCSLPAKCGTPKCESCICALESVALLVSSQVVLGVSSDREMARDKLAGSDFWHVVVFGQLGEMRVHSLDPLSMRHAGRLLNLPLLPHASDFVKLALRGCPCIRNFPFRRVVVALDSLRVLHRSIEPVSTRCTRFRDRL